MSRGMEFPPWPCVYAVSTGRRRVKIGHTCDMAKRFADLQHASPYRLRILATMPGGLPEERWLHREFKRFRRHGEWFDLSASQQARLLELMSSENPGRIEARKPKYVPAKPRASKVKRYWMLPEVREEAEAHVKLHFSPESVEIVLSDDEAMEAFQRNIARRMRKAGQL